MTTWTLSTIPIAMVLKNGGKMKFSELANTLMEGDPTRFKDLKTVEKAVNNYNQCLDFDGDKVVFNKEAKQYAAYPIQERSVQAFLHSALKSTAEEWQLYPYKSRKNSSECYMGISWENIPGEDSPDQVSYPVDCDFRLEGEDSCNGGCGYDIQNRNESSMENDEDDNFLQDLLSELKDRK